jgi:hypothetical protein
MQVGRLEESEAALNKALVALESDGIEFHSDVIQPCALRFSYYPHGLLHLPTHPLSGERKFSKYIYLSDCLYHNNIQVSHISSTKKELCDTPGRVNKVLTHDFSGEAGSHWQ